MSSEKDEFFANARVDLTGPLAGVRVLEVTTTWADPMAGVVLADLGADVIKVEIRSGDVARSLIPVQTFAEVVKDPGVIARDMLQPVTQYDGHTVDIVGPSVKFSRIPRQSGVLPRRSVNINDEILDEINVEKLVRAQLRNAV